MQNDLDRVDEWLIYEDDHLVVVNKPSGLRTIPDGYDPTLPNLFGLLCQKFNRLWIVHRLDKETSGILLFARDAEAHRRLNHQFEKRKIEKTYHAIVTGTPLWDDKHIDLPLLVNGDRKHRTIVDHQQGRPAGSYAVVQARFMHTTLLSVYPKTGYTHQIRAHLAAIGFPILFDALYHRSSDLPNPIMNTTTRLALHAYRIQFIHPFSNRVMQLDAPYPLDFEEMLTILT
jgi:tRNA pseudouridine32 synthase / 23S rRNA pseudouridine746 synthase